MVSKTYYNFFTFLFFYFATLYTNLSEGSFSTNREFSLNDSRLTWPNLSIFYNFIATYKNYSICNLLSNFTIAAFALKEEEKNI